MRKISGIILTRNNERTIKEAVNSIKDIVDELLIIDDSSTDKTLEIIKSIYPEAKIFQRKLDRFDAQRNFGIEKANYDWILMIDSDEIVTRELGRSIVAAMENPQYDAYICYRLNKIFPNYSVRDFMVERPLLFKNLFQFTGALHESMKVERFGILAGDLLHNVHFNLTSWLQKTPTIKLHAQKWLDQGREYGLFTLAILVFFLPIYEFFKKFFIQKAFKNGFFEGFLYALVHSWYWVFVIMYYYELRHKEKASSKEYIRKDLRQ